MINTFKTKTNGIEWARVNNDINGNPRYVCHFLNFVKDSNLPLMEKFEMALKRAKEIGGKKYRGKEYGGGIVFQSYNLDSTEEAIEGIKGN